MKYSLKVHEKKHRVTDKSFVKCDFCDYEAKSEAKLKRHIDSMKRYNEQSHQSIA